jgi:glycosyltransferase involved in cell wall biosynthesis
MHKELTIRPQKVLLVITKSNWGGAQKYVYDIATELSERGHPVMVACGGKGELVERLRTAGVPVHELHKLKNNMNPFSSLSAFFELVRLFRETRPDVVHLNSSKVGFFGTLAGRVAHVPRIVFTAHGWPFSEERPLWQKVFLKSLMQVTVMLSHKMICVSHTTLARLSAPQWLEKKCVVVHNGIAPIAFKSPTSFYEDMHMMRRERIAMVSIGELHPSKGFDIALGYLRSMQDLSWEWFILGEGGEKSRLTAMIKDHNLSSRVHLMGHIKDAATYLESFDLFFLPSRTEALAYVAIEALQSDLPIIASDVGGIPEVLGRDSGTTLITVRDPKTKETLRAQLSLTHKKVSDSARENLRNEFSLSNMIDKTIAVYRQ